MLNLKRKIGEALIINDEIEIVLIAVTKNGATLGISYPQGARVFRKEIFVKIMQENMDASQVDIDLLSKDSTKIDE